MRALTLGLLLAAGCQTAPTPTPGYDAAVAAWDSLGAETSASDWTVTPDGAGSLEVGSTEHAAAGRRVIEVGGADAGDCFYFHPHSAPLGLSAMVFEGEVARIDVHEPVAATAEGVGVGSPVADVLEAYGDRVTAEPHAYTDGQYLVVDAGAERQIVFETDGQTVARFRAGRAPEVGWVEGCS